MRMRMAVAALVLAATSACAAVEYLPELDALWVSDYPQAYPCTPELLARVDAARGWGKVTYDEAGQCCTVACSLLIGRNDGSETWFQVGSARRPRETLIVRGDLRVYSTWLVGENSEEMRAGRNRVNRLTLGVRDDPSVQPSLLIDNEARAGHTITIGGTSGYGSENQGGDLCAYHATIAPAGEVPIGTGDDRSRSISLGGKGIVELIGCTVRGVAATAFGAAFTAGVFEDTRFEDCGTAILGTYQEHVRGCSFVNCGTAISAGARHPLKLMGCRFEGNERDWVVRYLPAIAIDCEAGTFDRGSYSAEHATFLVSKRHVRVRVVDEQGQPVSGAQVRASTAQEVAAPEFELREAATGTDGLTPPAGADGALLLSELVIRAPEDEGGEPQRAEYAWTIEARAGERVGRVEAYTPRSSAEVVEVVVTAQ